MSKIPFHDVVPPGKRSIRNIQISHTGRRKVSAPTNINERDYAEPVINESPKFKQDVRIKETVKEESSEFYPTQRPVRSRRVEEEDFETENKPPKKRKALFIGIAVLLILGFIVGMMTVFASATVEVTPKSQDIDVSLSINASNDAATASSSPVKYEIIKVSKQKTTVLPATGKEQVELKARGKIIIYNNFSTEAQRLIVRTRFETTDGLIFRIPESITVPGKTVKNGVETPGSIEVEVQADEPGQKYNIKKADFTIPGFKSEPERFSKFYARGVTDMTGGFVGEMKKVDDTSKQAAFKTIETDLQTELEKDLETKVPEGMTLLKGSIVYESVEVPQKEDSNGVAVGKEMTGYAIMLNKEDLSKKIASEYMAGLPEWGNIKPEVANFELLSITKKPERITNGGTLNLEIGGKVKVLAEINETLVGEKLAGNARSNTTAIIDEFPGISSVKVTIRPIWKQSFPSDSAKIHVERASLE